MNQRSLPSSKTTNLMFNVGENIVVHYDPENSLSAYDVQNIAAEIEKQFSFFRRYDGIEILVPTEVSKDYAETLSHHIFSSLDYPKPKLAREDSFPLKVSAMTGFGASYSTYPFNYVFAGFSLLWVSFWLGPYLHDFYKHRKHRKLRSIPIRIRFDDQVSC